MNKVLKIILVVLGSLVVIFVALVIYSYYIADRPSFTNHLEEDAACSKANGGQPCW